MEDRQINQYIEERVVQIREVNMAQSMIVVRDPFGSDLRISMHLLSPHVAIPQVGESWTAKRQGVDWLLIRRKETDYEVKKVTTLNPGDHRIEAPEALFVIGTDVIIGGDAELIGGGSSGGLLGDDLITVAIEGIEKGLRPTINFQAGPGITIDATDNPGSDRVDVTVSAAAGLTAAQIAYDGGPGISATNVEGALDELAAEKPGLAMIIALG